MSRMQKIAEAIRQEASMVIHDKLKDPRLGFVTVTRVEVVADLRLARIYFSVLGKDEDYKKTKEALDSGLGFIRRLVAQRLNLRIAPEIMFIEDRSSEYSVRIQEVLNEIKALEKQPPAVDKSKKTIKRKERKVELKKSSRVHKKK
ncbi:MAG: 30S ribosome-binding factor RbfA [Candidatus Omnitrophota bacterium]